MGRQKKWMEELSEYDVQLHHRAGKLNVVADALSRRSDYGDDVLAINSLEWTTIQEELLADIKEAVRDDKDYQALVADVTAKKRHDYTLLYGLLYKDTRLVVPNKQIQESLLELGHDGPLGGHLGRDKTLERLQRCYYWAKMSYDVQEYCRTCTSCQLTKPSQQKQIGLLHPLPIPGRPWESIGIDFVTGLPITKEGYSVLMTVVDRLSKFLVLIPTVSTFDTTLVAELFLAHVVKRFGFPLSIVSDRDPRFISLFWKELMNQAGVKRKMSSAAHPQTDGVTEQANRTVASMARSYVQSNPKDWADRLPTLEVAYNDSVNSSTGYSPYFLTSGTNPILPLSLYAAPTFLTATTVDKSVREFVERTRADVAFARLSMEKAQARQVKYANQHRRDVTFAVGDKVLLSEHHFKETTGSNLAQADGSTKKLNALHRGPFEVTEVINKVVYRLQLPTYMQGRTHNAFHVSRLRPYLTTENFPARTAKEAAPEVQKELDGEHFEVAAVQGHRLTGHGGRHLQVLVQFKGLHEREWQFAADLSRPPGLSVAYYFELLSKYAASHPRGTGKAGRPPTGEQLVQLRLRLEDELKRAEWAKRASDVESQSQHDTDRGEDTTITPKPKKKAGGRVGDASFKGGRSRDLCEPTLSATAAPATVTTREARASAREQQSRRTPALTVPEPSATLPHHQRKKIKGSNPKRSAT